ncbi:putative disease resistance protein RGA1 [Quercus lobata]|uniref:putative disease resistance protein RGA1 n=1 Tax=Quercus lobata TaxID=97700 RepID=UPI00124430B3|nr:putative disease resistance protein RGA1 [Quercus lobata]
MGATSCYALRGLPKEKAWSLFVKIAFERGQEPKNKALVAIGEKIVEDCDGLPLAIRTIGSILYPNTSEKKWQSFLDNELSKIDHKINVYTLINLWAAQGFIVLVGPKQCFEDVGRKYFMELLWRSFFQDVENDELGNIESCKMHDLMHNLVGLVSGLECAILNSSKENDIEKLRHVSFNLVDLSMQFSIPMLNGRKIHTVLVSSVGGNLGNLTRDALISNFKYLRTLDLSYLGLHVGPRSNGKLKHLRYLDLSRNYEIKNLPNSITKMLNLQTLILRNCDSLRELPKGIKKLVNLWFLDITNCRQLINMHTITKIIAYKELTYMPLEIGHHTYLETILPFVVVRKESSGASNCGSDKKKKAKSNGGLSDLKGLRNLGGNLRIEKLGHGKDEVQECNDTNLKDKQHLQELILWWDLWNGESKGYDEMLEGLYPHPNLKALELWYYVGVRIPSWVSPLTNLVKFELNQNRRLQHIPSLNQLSFLKSISLWGMDALEYISDEDSIRDPRPLAIQTQEAGLHLNYHAPLRAKTSSGKFPLAASDSSLSNRLLGTCATVTASLSTDLQNLKLWASTELTRASTRLLSFWLLLHAPVTSHAPASGRKLLLMSSDVTE